MALLAWTYAPRWAAVSLAAPAAGLAQPGARPSASLRASLWPAAGWACRREMGAGGEGRVSGAGCASYQIGLSSC